MSEQLQEEVRALALRIARLEVELAEMKAGVMVPSDPVRAAFLNWHRRMVENERRTQ